MEPTLPLILLEGTDGPQDGPPRSGDPRLFDSVDALVAAVDAPDVRAGIVQAFDAEGRRLRLSADDAGTGVTATVEPAPAYVDALRDVLAAAVRSSPHLYPSISPDRPLDQLVAAIWRVEQAAQAHRRMQRVKLYRQVGLWIVILGVLLVAQPPVLQARAEVPTPIFLGLWVTAAIVAYWLAGRLLLLFSADSISSNRG